MSDTPTASIRFFEWQKQVESLVAHYKAPFSRIIAGVPSNIADIISGTEIALVNIVEDPRTGDTILGDPPILRGTIEELQAHWDRQSLRTRDQLKEWGFGAYAIRAHANNDATRAALSCAITPEAGCTYWSPEFGFFSMDEQGSLVNPFTEGLLPPLSDRLKRHGCVFWGCKVLDASELLDDVELTVAT